MTRWEYCTVYSNQAVFYTSQGGNIIALHQQGMTPDKLWQHRAQFIAQLGLEGWEAFGVGDEPRVSAMHFKRPIS